MGWPEGDMPAVTSIILRMIIIINSSYVKGYELSLLAKWMKMMEGKKSLRPTQFSSDWLTAWIKVLYGKWNTASGARWEGLMPFPCTNYQPWLKLCLESHWADTPSRCIKDLPCDLPKECHTKMSLSDNFNGAGAWTTPGAYVYIHRLLHRLGYRIGNHRQLPFGSIQWVTDLPTCNASQTCCVWL